MPSVLAFGHIAENRLIYVRNRRLMVHVLGIQWAGYSKNSVRPAAMFIYY